MALSTPTMEVVFALGDILKVRIPPSSFLTFSVIESIIQLISTYRTYKSRVLRHLAVVVKLLPPWHKKIL